MVIEIIFWIAVLLILHTYLFYPLILSFLSKNTQENKIFYSGEDDLPYVSIIIAAYNEEDVIAEKITSIYKNLYPEDKYEVLIGSDNSDDRTNEIIEDHVNRYNSLRFFNFETRRGKGNVVNELVSSAKGEILILTDANVFFDKDTIFNLVRHFKNEGIGLVDTNMINTGQRKEGISYEETAYISREVKIKNMEGRLWGTMMGPFGGCYAIRKEDYTRVPENYLVDDFYINMKILEKGKKAINDFDAKVFEVVSNNIFDEFRRKIRIATGNFQNLKTFYALLFVKNVGFCFLSHKVLRWLGPFFMILALVMNIILFDRGIFYQVTLYLQLLMMVLPFADLLLKQFNIHSRFLRLIRHFYAMNLALLVGFFRSLKTVKSGTWQRTRRDQ